MGILKHILRIIFPALCRKCNGLISTTAATAFFCIKCWEGIKWFDGNCCPRCGVPYPSCPPLPSRERVRVRGAASHTCGECIKNPPHFDGAFTAGPYSEVMAEAIKLFKYKKKIHIGLALSGHDVMASGITNLLQRHHSKSHPCNSEPVSESDSAKQFMLIPVPLHPVRLKEREFNQSVIIASVINSKLGIPVFTDVLFRQHYTKPQVGLAYKERKENIAGAFTVPNKAVIKGKEIILVDDVFTTGSTVNECAKVLKKNGAAKVFVVTVARMV